MRRESPAIVFGYLDWFTSRICTPLQLVTWFSIKPKKMDVTHVTSMHCPAFYGGDVDPKVASILIITDQGEEYEELNRKRWES